MTQPIAGWYTDPAGDSTKLRYWDGTKWTDNLMDAPAPQPSTVPQPDSSPASDPSQTANADEPVFQAPVGQPACFEATPIPNGPGSVPESGNLPVYMNYGDMPLYYVSPQDSTLRLVAFILALISTVTTSFAIIPLFWMIPMTIRTWGIYKGKRPNTVAFDVCSLIFLNLVGGVLLLASNKDE